jgi:hypothetical protein
MLTVFRQPTWLYLFTITSFGIAIGALWEVTEWTAGKILPSEVIGSLDDTIVDLIMDSLGAGFAAAISLWVLQHSSLQVATVGRRRILSQCRMQQRKRF